MSFLVFLDTSDGVEGFFFKRQGIEVTRSNVEGVGAVLVTFHRVPHHPNALSGTVSARYEHQKAHT